MLAPISGTRRDGGSSFRALKNYLGFKKNKQTGELDRRSELLISESLLSEQTAQAEMRAVASENLRVKDPVYHYQLCWQENEFPEKEQWKAAAEKSIRALGFGEHQYIIAPHNDTDHFHVHVMVNRVHPDTYKAHYPEFSKRSLDQAIREIEAEQGWKESKGLFRWDREQGRAIQNTRQEMQAAGSSGVYAVDEKAANKLETHTDTESLETYAKAGPAKEITSLMKSGQKVNWADIYSVLVKHGLELERGEKSGYKVRAVGTELRVKASSVFRETFAGKENRARLEKLEGWESRVGISSARPTEVYKPRPLKRDPGERAERREQRADERKVLKEAYRVYKSGLQTDLKARADSIRVQLKQITVAYGQERAAIRGSGSANRPADRKAALSLAAMKAATDRSGLQAQLRGVRAAGALMSYRDWVTGQAQIGNRAAIGQLRGFAFRERRMTGTMPAASIVIESPEESFRSTDYRPLNRSDLKATVYRNGDVQYFQDGKALFIDQGRKISLLQQSETAYVAALRLGQAKFGSRLHITGTEVERKAFALAAAKHGMQVQFTDERMNIWMRETSKPAKAIAAKEVSLPEELEVLIQKTKGMYPKFAKEFLSRYADPAARPILTAEERWSVTQDAHELAELHVKEAAISKKIAIKHEQLVDFVVAKNEWEQGHKWQTNMKSQAWTALNDEHTLLFKRHHALEGELANLRTSREEIKKLRVRAMATYIEQERNDIEEERSRQSVAAEVDRHRPAFEKRINEQIDRLATRQKQRREQAIEDNEPSL
ncbi:TraI/MobA(P) family conjugative relaxase [Granulicella arctica]|uniref:TraI/MobA(P) family conjugative relaxase n=1 Tax=Granulicella arctica TaxID=940613 RepID=UPI0021DFC2C7|nr:TraI/MobA(P) family conjugative relaxase [Granulicella arctica]